MGTTVSLGGVYAYVTQFKAEGTAAPALAFSPSLEGCRALEVITGAAPGVAIDRFRISPLDAGPSMISFAGRVAANATWSGDGLKGFVQAGQAITLWGAGSARAFGVVDVPSNTMIARLLAPDAPPDATAPIVSIDAPGSFNGTLPAITGTASEAGCSGIANVTVVVQDASSGAVWDGVAFSAGPAARLPAVLAAPGDITTSFVVNTSPLPWTPGHNYTFAADGTTAGGQAQQTPLALSRAVLSTSPPPVPPAPPVASFAWTATQLSVSVNATDARPGSAPIANYSWSWGDGSPSTDGLTAAHAYPTAGNFSIVLTVTSSDGTAASATQIVTTVPPPPPPPPVPPAAVVATMITNFTVSADGTRSTASGTSIVSWNWSWGDSTPGSTGPTAMHNYSRAGTFSVTLSVQDERGLWSNASTNVSVGACPSGNAAIASYHFLANDSRSLSGLRGNLHQGDTVQATFTIAPGCGATPVSLVSYTAPGPTFSASTANQQRVFQDVTGTYAPGTYALTVTAPECYYQVDFIRGAIITTLGPAGSNNFYSPQGRLIDADNGGTAACR